MGGGTQWLQQYTHAQYIPVTLGRVHGQQCFGVVSELGRIQHVAAIERHSASACHSPDTRLYAEELRRGLLLAENTLGSGPWPSGPPTPGSDPVRKKGDWGGLMSVAQTQNASI
jgi:hypothetical protein